MDDDQCPRSKRIKTDQSIYNKKKLIIVIEDCSLEIGKVFL